MRERNKTENKRLTAITSKPGKENQNSRLERQKKCVTVQYLHSYESKSIKNRLRRWDFDLYVSGFWHVHAKTPRGIVDC
ncbi:hypothetical protein DW952_08730 [Ruminococcus sp. AM44-9AT]|nr:hypothetical protein DW952_08730 [Ruminococcus sp. AM44-9AT]